MLEPHIQPPKRDSLTPPGTPPEYSVDSSVRLPHPDTDRSSYHDGRNTSHSGGVLKYLGLVFFCFVASFLGSWVYVGSGLIPLTHKTITENKQQLVVQEGEVIAAAAKKVSPSVVSILTREGGSTEGAFGMISQGAGTGMILDATGYILTNKHVIPEGVRSVQVITSDGTVYDDVAVVGRDTLNDIAFLKVDKPQGFQPVTFADTDMVEIGQKVLTIGNALGQFQNSVTSGIVSGIGRPLIAGGGGSATESLEGLIQTDAAINPGNSGGPLVNLNGEVIGINTAIADEAEGIGFAIPSNAAKGLVTTVIKTGQVKRGYLGVKYVTITSEIAKEYNLSVKHGAYIHDPRGGKPVVSGGPAEAAGMKAGDIITSVNGVSVDSRNVLSLLLGKYTIGDEVKLKVLRNDGGNKTLDVTLKLADLSL